MRCNPNCDLCLGSGVIRLPVHLQNRVMVRTGEDIMSLYWSVFTTLMLRCEEQDKQIKQLKQKLSALTPNLLLLNALLNGGVDNWEGYHESTKHLYQDEAEE